MTKLKLKLMESPAEKQPNVPFNLTNRKILESVYQPAKVEGMVEAHTRKYPPEKVPYYQWFYSENQLPPDVNEEIVVFYPHKNHFELSRSFVLLQNVFYRRTQKYPYDPFYWMRFRGVHGKEHYPQ